MRDVLAEALVVVLALRLADRIIPNSPLDRACRAIEAECDAREVSERVAAHRKDGSKREVTVTEHEDGIGAEVASTEGEVL